MQRWMCKGKIHRATVTEANLDYVGSITIDALLMKAADIRPYEMVQVTCFRNAARWKTYALPGAEGSGEICLNGPPAQLFEPGDKVVILSMGGFDEREMLELAPCVVFVDERNTITDMKEHRLFDEKGEVNWDELRPGKADQI